MKDNVEPEGKWKFDESVAASFDDMLARSIPMYDQMRSLCFQLGEKYVKPNTWIVDLGCARGKAIEPFVKTYSALNKFMCIEMSEPMRKEAEKNLGTLNASELDILSIDLREWYPDVVASLTLCVLTAQFIPIEHRQKLISRIYEHTEADGALIFVEKILGEGVLDEAMVDIYYALKRDHGYSQDSIDRKRLSLEGVLVPMTAKWNEDMLKTAGFRHVDCFWRWMNFAGWIAVK